jgi:hypothetical protein
LEDGIFRVTKSAAVSLVSSGTDVTVIRNGSATLAQASLDLRRDIVRSLIPGIAGRERRL